MVVAMLSSRQTSFLVADDADFDMHRHDLGVWQTSWGQCVQSLVPKNNLLDPWKYFHDVTPQRLL